MLQQTQVARVIPKFEAFMYTCPDIASLAQAPLSQVVTLWSGLGYNRRAQFLHQTARMIVSSFESNVPDTLEQLVTLPGIGKNTAGAILAYAFEQPVVFIETNIRTVLFHHFYADSVNTVSDAELEQVVAQTVDRDQPREWYWALMDYGSYLKKTAGAQLTSSSHYVKQTPLKGSLREMRGRILKRLVGGACSRTDLYDAVLGDERFDRALASLVRDGLVDAFGDRIGLTGAGKTS
jgi:A/G-specific adenine glycosylase